MLDQARTIDGETGAVRGSWRGEEDDVVRVQKAKSKSRAQMIRRRID